MVLVPRPTVGSEMGIVNVYNKPAGGCRVPRSCRTVTRSWVAVLIGIWFPRISLNFDSQNCKIPWVVVLIGVLYSRISLCFVSKILRFVTPLYYYIIQKLYNMCVLITQLAIHLTPQVFGGRGTRGESP